MDDHTERLLVHPAYRGLQSVIWPTQSVRDCAETSAARCPVFCSGHRLHGYRQVAAETQGSRCERYETARRHDEAEISWFRLPLARSGSSQVSISIIEHCVRPCTHLGSLRICLLPYLMIVRDSFCNGSDMSVALESLPLPVFPANPVILG